MYYFCFFPSHLKKFRSILRFWIEKLNCGFFHSFHSRKTPQYNFSSQNFSVENNYFWRFCWRFFWTRNQKSIAIKKNFNLRLQVPRWKISIYLKPTIYVFSIQPLFSFSLLGHSKWNRRYRSQSNCITNRPTLHRLLQFFDQNSHYRIISIRIFDIFERLYLSRN